MLQFVHDFCGSEKVNEKSKEAFNNLVTFSKKLELDLQEDNLTELPALKHRKITNTDLMELEAQRKDEKKQKEEGAEEPKRFTTQEMTRRCLF